MWFRQRTLVGLAVVLIVGAGVSAAAQGAADAPKRAERDGTQARAEAEEVVDVSRLPIDLDRIHRRLRNSTIREERVGLNLRYTIEVYGQAPPLVFFGPEANLETGPVPYGAPTHQEMIEHVTPREYRAPAADFSALLRWLAERANK